MNSAAAALAGDPHDLVRFPREFPSGQAGPSEPSQNGFLSAWGVNRGAWTNEAQRER
jgi:hypothetical protein